MLAVATGGPSVQVSGWVAAVVIVGALCASLSAIAVFVTRSQKLFTAAVGQIVETHLAPVKAQVTKELTPNGGSSLVDKVDKLVRSADDTNVRLVKIETDRASQVPMFMEDHQKLAELHAYAHQNTHDIRSAIAVLTTATQESGSLVPALTSVAGELKAAREAIAPKGETP